MTTHKINAGDAQPIKQAPRRILVKKGDEAGRAVSEMDEQEIVESSSSPWCSPVVLFWKKDDSTRFCVDYRKLNDVTRKDSFPLPRADVTLDALNVAKCIGVARSISGGDIFIYSCSAQLSSLERESISKEINFAEHEYMYMSSSLIELVTPLAKWISTFDLKS